MTPTHAVRQPVLVLHGLWMHAPAMRWFTTRLRSQGFDARAFGYYSIAQDTPRAVEAIAAALAASPRTHVVGHSLGGLLALQAAQRAGVHVGRVACLGTSLAGSRAAAGVVRLRGGRHLIGPHRDLLQAGLSAIPQGIEVGMIAGCLPRGLGGLFARFDEPHDGTVAVGETRIPGLADHIVLQASHSGLIFSDDAVRNAVQFLRHGQFAQGA